MGWMVANLPTHLLPSALSSKYPSPYRGVLSPIPILAGKKRLMNGERSSGVWRGGTMQPRTFCPGPCAGRIEVWEFRCEDLCCWTCAARSKFPGHASMNHRYQRCLFRSPGQQNIHMLAPPTLSEISPTSHTIDCSRYATEVFYVAHFTSSLDLAIVIAALRFISPLCFSYHLWGLFYQ